jgi:sec-independent protein translocase protein TatC
MAITEAPPPAAAPGPDEQHAPGDREMTLLEHLEELRGRLVAMVLAVIVGVLVSIIPIPTMTSLTGFLFDVIIAQAHAVGVTVTAIKPGEAFFTYLEVSLIVGAAIAMPVIIYQILAFVSPALYANEKRYLYLAVPGVFFSFLCGILFCYYLTLPFATKFLAGFLSNDIQPFWTVQNYVSFVAGFLFWVGVMFELPIVMFFLSKIGVVSHQRMARFRKYAFVLAFVIGAAITPTPDPINQTLISLPIYFLFELGVILARFA